MNEGRRPLDALQDLGRMWAGTAALATVVVYALGYLSLRSHHTALGIDVDLGVFDDRYPFAGARFLVFALVSLVPWAIPLLLLGAIWHAIRRAGGPPGLPGWLDGGVRWALLGLLAFVTVMSSQVLVVHDLLLGQRLPNAMVADKLICWLAAEPDPGRRDTGWGYLNISFKLLLLAAGLTIAWAWYEGRQVEPARRILALLLWLLAAVELMLLPVYHGTFFADRIVRRLEGAPARIEGLAEDVWLVYRGSAQGVLFARDPAQRPRLVTVDAATLNGWPLVGVEDISKLLEIKGCARP